MAAHSGLIRQRGHSPLDQRGRRELSSRPKAGSSVEKAPWQLKNAVTNSYSAGRVPQKWICWPHLPPNLLSLAVLSIGQTWLEVWGQRSSWSMLTNKRMRNTGNDGLYRHGIIVEIIRHDSTAVSTYNNKSSSLADRLSLWSPRTISHPTFYSQCPAWGLVC